MSVPLISGITHIIFDLDGLLIDTETCYTIATNNVSKRYGKEFTWDLKTKLMGLSPKESSRLAISELNLPLDENKYLELINEEFCVAIKNIELMPGSEQLVKHLHKHNIPMAIATGSDTQSFATKTERFNEFFKQNKYFNHFVLAGDDPHVKRGKPWPDVFIEAMNRFETNLKPENVLVFEDSPIGVRAALAAQMHCVWVPDLRTDISQENATIILKSLEEFKPEHFGLPSFADSDK